MRFILRLSYVDGHGIPTERDINRPTQAEAIDAAQRWLRLTRNTAGPYARQYNTWSVLIPNEERGVTVIAEGAHVEQHQR